MPFDGRGLFPLAFLGRFFVVLSSAQLCQNTGFLTGAFESTQCCIEMFALSYADAWHQ